MTRLEQIREILFQEHLDAFCVRDTSNIAYLTGFEGVFDEEQAHALLVGPTSATLHTDSRYANACEEAASGIQSSIAVDAEALTHAKWLAKQQVSGTLGIEDSITLAEYRKLEEVFEGAVELRETSGVVSKLRSVKSADEVARLRGAQAITDAAFAHICDFMHPGLTEKEVQRELDNYMLSHGASALAFPSIVACGPNGANPHAQPTEAVLEAGQCVVMDFGAKARGYCSDMTRTVFLGEPTAQLLRAYEVLREANETVEAALKPGMAGAEAHQMALDVLEAGGFGGRMGHGLGHGVGMDVHEDPVLSPRNKEALAAGNVVTVEPGIYIPGEFGMRLEDFGIITDTGFDVFTASSHEPVVI